MKTYYSPSHEYVRVDGNVGFIGITDYAQHALGNIVYVDMPVKAASDLISPVSGAVLEQNEQLIDNPRLINENAVENWIIKVELTNPAELDSLLDEAAYAELCAKEQH